MALKQESKISQKHYEHFGTWDYHDDDCRCMLADDMWCNRDGRCWSCCGAVVEKSTCARKGNKHHSAVSNRSDAGKCNCKDCDRKHKKKTK